MLKLSDQQQTITTSAVTTTGSNSTTKQMMHHRFSVNDILSPFNNIERNQDLKLKVKIFTRKQMEYQKVLFSLL
ncbi:hypothetical protein ACH3XW_36785 [Acanthocheilonema viteae]